MFSSRFNHIYYIGEFWHQAFFWPTTKEGVRHSMKPQHYNIYKHLWNINQTWCNQMYKVADQNQPKEKLHFEVSFKCLDATLYCFPGRENRAGFPSFFSPCHWKHCAFKRVKQGPPCTILLSSTTCNSIRSCPESYNQVFWKVCKN